MSESTKVPAVPAEVVNAKTSVEEPPVAVQATAPFLLSASRVPSCVVATWMSRATTARGQLPLASSEKHHTLSVMSRSSRASAANHLSTFRPRCQGRRCASGVTTPRANRPNSATDSGYFRAQYLDRVIDMPVVTQPQVQMFLKVKSTTEIPQVPFMMVHRWNQKSTLPTPLRDGVRFVSWPSRLQSTTNGPVQALRLLFSPR